MVTIIILALLIVAVPLIALGCGTKLAEPDARLKGVEQAILLDARTAVDAVEQKL